MQTASPNQLVADHLSYAEALTVETIDRLSLRALINLDEALSFVNAALTEAAHRYQPTIGRTGQAVPFTTFSFPRIRGAVIEAVRKTRSGRRDYERSRDASAALEQRTAPYPSDCFTAGPALLTKLESGSEVAADLTSQNPAFARETEHALYRETFEALGRRDSVLKAIRQLPEIEQQIVFLHFYEDLPCERIARRLGISGSYALRLRNKALLSLRKSLKDFDTNGGGGGLQ
jgi:RNA polymerase sigma factor (sigma-70 family)